MKTVLFTGTRAGWLPAIVGLLIGVSGCGPDPKPVSPSQSQSPLPPVRVRVAVVENHGLAATEEVVGTVRARLHATVEAKVTGRMFI